MTDKPGFWGMEKYKDEMHELLEERTRQQNFVKASNITDELDVGPRNAGKLLRLAQDYGWVVQWSSGKGGGITYEIII